MCINILISLYRVLCVYTSLLLLLLMQPFVEGLESINSTPAGTSIAKPHIAAKFEAAFQEVCICFICISICIYPCMI